MFFYVSDFVPLIGITYKYIDLKCTEWTSLKPHRLCIYLQLDFEPLKSEIGLFMHYLYTTPDSLKLKIFNCVGFILFLVVSDLPCKMC
jgi:hypothetical protein